MPSLLCIICICTRKHVLLYNSKHLMPNLSTRQQRAIYQFSIDFRRVRKGFRRGSRIVNRLELININLSTNIVLFYTTVTSPNRLRDQNKSMSLSWSNHCFLLSYSSVNVSDYLYTQVNWHTHWHMATYLRKCRRVCFFQDTFVFICF